MRYSKFMLTPVAAGGALFLGAHTAHADFSGDYAPENWTWVLSDPASNSSFKNDGTTLTLISGDGDSLQCLGQYLIFAPEAGIISFDWEYTSVDTGTFDWGGYTLGLGEPSTILAYNEDAPASGSLDLGIAAGQFFSFDIYTDDGIFGPGVLTITQFAFTVPAPGSLALLGLAGLASRRRRAP